MEKDLILENQKLREQIEILTQALAEAMVICAKWSPGGLDSLQSFLKETNNA